jgi:hypothetical protein
MAGIRILCSVLSSFTMGKLFLEDNVIAGSFGFKGGPTVNSGF